MKVPIEQVKIKEERFREDYGEIEELAVSIQRYGLFHPIIVDDKLNLIAGERRLKAHRLLGLKEVEIRKVTDVSELERREIEIEENLKRKDFTWQEQVKAVQEVDRIKRELYGHAIKGHGGGWSIRDTADSMGSSLGKVSEDLKLARIIEEYPDLAKETTKDAAKKKYAKLKEAAIVETLASRVKVKVDTSCVVNGDSSVVMRGLANQSVDLVFTDPPFAVALDKGGVKHMDRWAGKVYDDESQHVLNTISLVVRECYRVLKDGRHMYLWFGIQHYDYVLKMLIDVGFNVNAVPCVWHKIKGGGPGGSEYAYASNYEVCLFAMKGRRPLNRLGQSNVWEEQRVHQSRKVHPTEKPTGLIRRCVEQSTQPGELVIDPFAGSGSTLMAALECKRNVWGCELDKEYYSQIVLKLEKMQKMEAGVSVEGEKVKDV